jgi:hypothetical protein
MSAYIESGMSVRGRIASRKLPFLFPNATYMVGDVFPSYPFQKVLKIFPVAPLLVLTRTAIGLGLGIWIADKNKTSAASSDRFHADGNRCVGPRHRGW